MKNNNYKVNQYRFYIDDMLLINAPSVIEKFLILDTKIILLLQEKILENDKNIYCFDFKGNFLWIVSDVIKLHDKNYFTNMYINENNELMAYNLNGTEVTIDVDTGRIIKAELIR
jgi:hypothetical protein